MSGAAAPCAKVSFPTYALALRRLFEIALGPPRDARPRPVDAYYCRECRAWHLTSRRT